MTFESRRLNTPRPTSPLSSAGGAKPTAPGHLPLPPSFVSGIDQKPPVLRTFKEEGLKEEGKRKEVASGRVTTLAGVVIPSLSSFALSVTACTVLRQRGV